MNDKLKDVMFEWDAYWDEDDTDGKAQHRVSEPVYDYDPPSAAQAEHALETAGRRRPSSPAASGWRTGIVAWGTPVLVLGAFLVATTLPQSLGLDGVKIQSSDLIGLSPRQAEPVKEQVQLLAYSDRQQEMFSTGLRRLGDAELLAYARRAQDDLLHADAAMSLPLQDALTLTRLEVERRKLTFPAAPARVQVQAQAMPPAQPQPVVAPAPAPVVSAPEWAARSDSHAPMPASLLPLLPSPNTVLIPLPE